jgi:Transposase
MKNLARRIFSMKRSRFTEQQIASALQQAAHGTQVAEVTGKIGINEPTFYRCKKKFALGNHFLDFLHAGDLAHHLDLSVHHQGRGREDAEGHDLAQLAHLFHFKITAERFGRFFRTFDQFHALGATRA